MSAVMPSLLLYIFMADIRDKLYLSSHLMMKTEPLSGTHCVQISR
jgi:hypothetical protein